MVAKDPHQGKVIADAANTLAAGINQTALKERLWNIAQNALGAETCPATRSDALHMVQTELCTLCKEQQLIACGGYHNEDCDLVHIVTAGKRPEGMR